MRGFPVTGDMPPEGYGDPSLFLPLHFRHKGSFLVLSGPCHVGHLDTGPRAMGPPDLGLKRPKL